MLYKFSIDKINENSIMKKLVNFEYDDVIYYYIFTIYVDMVFYLNTHVYY